MPSRSTFMFGPPASQCEYSPVFAARMRPTQLAMSLVVVLEPEKSFFGRSFELWDRRCRWTHGVRMAARLSAWFGRRFTSLVLAGLANSSPGDTVAFDEE